MTKLNSNAAKIWTKAATVGAMVFVAVQLSGCAGIGPPTVDRDRFDYVSAISESWKRQTLLNLLKTRYLDAPGVLHHVMNRGIECRIVLLRELLKS